jgi:polysaccharide deacetylase family protein (PEP-CTERM system associated)
MVPFSRRQSTDGTTAARGHSATRSADRLPDGPLNALSVDVEDYYHVSAFEKHISRAQWSEFPSRVVANTRRILALLDSSQVKATFFVLGWVAKRHPGLVREIHGLGHEIASHGFWHRLVYSQSPEEFRADVRLSRDLLQEIVGRPVTAYRAPSFSITRRSLWAIEILAEEGFLTDTSVFPIVHDRYGIPGAQRTLHQIATSAGSIWEFPSATIRFAGVNLPVGGGGYFRLLPLRWTIDALARFNRTTGEPFIFYVHPWELDPGQPRFRAASPVTRFRHYVNLSKTERKLQWLLRAFRFGPLCDVVPCNVGGECRERQGRVLPC